MIFHWSFVNQHVEIIFKRVIDGTLNMIFIVIGYFMSLW